MQRRGGGASSVYALAADFRPQHGVIEALLRGLQPWRPAVITAASHAVRPVQRLVEGDGIASFGDKRPFDGADADIRHLVTGGAAIRNNSLERCVADKAVGSDAAVRRDQRTRVTIRYGHRKASPVSPHRLMAISQKPQWRISSTPQNSQFAMICANASTPNASVVGRWMTHHALNASNVRLSH